MTTIWSSAQFLEALPAMLLRQFTKAMSWRVEGWNATFFLVPRKVALKPLQYQGFRSPQPLLFFRGGIIGNICSVNVVFTILVPLLFFRGGIIGNHFSLLATMATRQSRFYSLGAELLEIGRRRLGKHLLECRFYSLGAELLEILTDHFLTSLEILPLLFFRGGIIGNT